MREYNFREIEKKWQKKWEDNGAFKTNVKSNKPKFYALDMFPYPSGAGLHVGHPEGYTATDIIARMKRMQGYEVMHPIGWDAFGLPAEQYALQTGHNPKDFTQKNINTFKRQIKSLGFSYDWDREINTTDPNYYRWTQWIFKKLFENDLAEIKEVPVNFCPECKTVLANEEVINGKCERKGHDVIKKPMKQWVLKITKYAERLLEDLEDLDWPESLKEQQRNWIGKSEGTKVKFKVENSNLEIEVFTTRLDTLYGVSYLVVAPEYEFINDFITSDNFDKCHTFIERVKNEEEIKRTGADTEKRGIFTGSYAIHPLTKEKLPIWTADYVLNTYGTGAVMAVPAHDMRDYVFAEEYDLPIKQVIQAKELPFVGDGKHINSKELDGKSNSEAKEIMQELVEEKGVGEKTINYKIRDWLFSRQRYWGEPFPIYFDKKNIPHTIPDDELPIVLPELDKIEPSDTGESPLKNAKEWLNYKGIGTMDTNTMPQWAGSCWYYLRYLDPNNQKELVEPNIAKEWLPVDFYIGGAEHAVLHLLYARFWHKFLYDINIVPTKEPFQKIFNQGMILGENHEKMSKSKGNVVNPDKIVETHGADALRVYEMFMGPLDATIAWSENGLDGSKKFLDRIFKLYQNKKIIDENKNLDKIYNQMIKKVTEDYEKLSFNTAISQMMIFLNSALKEDSISEQQARGFVKVLAPVAPHIAEEIWSSEDMIGAEDYLYQTSWPEVDASKLIDDKIEIIIQINGKLKAKINVVKDLAQDEIIDLSKEKIADKLVDQRIIKEIAVVNKLVNFVVE